MAYQSIYASGNLTPTLKTPLKYVAPAPTIAKVDPNSFKDIPSLNAAVKAGTVSKQAGLARLKQLIPQGPKVPTNLVGQVKAYGPSVVNEQDIQPVKNTFVGAYQQAKNQAKYLAQPAATQQQRNNIVNNQVKAQNNSEFQKAVQGLDLSKNSAAGKVQAQKMAASGAKGAQIKSFLQKDAQALNAQTSKGINAAATITAFSAPGEGILAKTAAKTGLKDALSAAKGSATAAIGKDEGTNALISGQRAVQASKSASIADKLGNSSIKEATTPKTTQIPVKGESTQVAGKAITNPDSKYVAASNKLSAQYEKDLSKVQKVPHPVTQKVLQTQLDQKYQGLQADLDNKFGQASVNFSGAAKAVKEPALPRSALNNGETPAFEPRTNPTTGVGPKITQAATAEPKQPTTTSIKPTEINTGPKVSGSALNSEQRAVEKGLVNDLGEKATYKGGGYKQEASNAVKLVNEKPEEARSIAMGEKSGNNTIHEVAVRRAVENKALNEGDVTTLRGLANSTQHTGTSEAAQRLGSEGFNADRNSPVQAIREISQARQKALIGKGSKADKVVTTTVKDIQRTTAPKLKVSRQDWQSFVEGLRC